MGDNTSNNIDSLLILDGETTFLHQEGYKKNKVITARIDFELFINKPFQVKNIIILVELNWGNPLSQFYGYEVAKALMNAPHRSGNFSLTFISTLSKEVIYKLNIGKNRVFTQKFPHITINTDFSLHNLPIPTLSERKFDYLKNYCLIESGILDRLEHDLRHLLSKQDPEKLSKLILELKANSDILTSDILIKADKINDGGSDIKHLLFELHTLIQELQKQFNNPGQTNSKKSRSVIMLIEDDLKTLEKLQDQFSQYFTNIRIFNNGTGAYNELEQNAQQYDVVITDMELLVDNFDDEKLGIDILELCEKKFPFLVTRVITSLPKNALSKLIKKTNLGEIIYKSASQENVIPPFENLVEFVHQIDKDVKQRRLLRSMRGPTGSWWGKYLTKELYLVQLHNPALYSSIWDNSIKKATAFRDSKLDKVHNNDKVGIEFKKINEISNNPESGWEIIELLLTHRMIALWFAAKHNWDEFYYCGEGIDVYTNLTGFQSGINTKPSKTYFNTILGLSAPGASDKRMERQKCKIVPKNLFSQEIEWLSNGEPDTLENMLIYEVNDLLQSFIERLAGAVGIQSLSEKSTYREALDVVDTIIGKCLSKELERKAKEKIKIIYDQDGEDLGEIKQPEAKKVIEQLRFEIQKF